MNLREAAQQALDALEMGCTDHDGNPVDLVGPAITALRAALAEDRSADTGKTSDHIADADKMVAASQEARQVEPVAYVTGYSKGRCIIEAVDPDWLLPVGMALYRSPQHQSEDSLGMVEPVAWLIESYDIYAKRTLQRLVFDNPKNMQGVKITAYYTAPPKSKPLTEEDIDALR